MTLEAAIVLTIILFLLIRFYFHKCYQFWEKKKVPTIEPRFPLGNSNTILPTGFSPGLITYEFYKNLKEKGHKFGGVYFFTEPHLVLIDPDYIKDILATDFQHFVNRGFYYNKEVDPLSAHLFALDGSHWRNLRIKLTPTFTSGKMKMMFPLIISCSRNIPKALHLNQDLDIKEIVSRYTTDVISSCAFGIDCNCLTNPQAEFRKMGQKIFDFSFWESLKNFLVFNLPELSFKLGIPTTKKDIEVFFMEAIAHVVNSRKNPENSRKDFLQLLIDIKDKNEISLDELSAQAFLFYIAGFETSSTAMTFTLYELAKNQEIQEKLRREILAVTEKYNNEISYESLGEMKYLGQVLDEALRMYTPIATLIRRCSKKYTLRNTNIELEKGTKILIPVFGIHRDPGIYPEPERFDPERFSDENKKERHPFVYLPFGNGPRNCIGLRFGLTQSKIGIATIIKHFKLRLSENCKPLEFDTQSFFFTPLHKVLLKAEEI